MDANPTPPLDNTETSREPDEPEDLTDEEQDDLNAAMADVRPVTYSGHDFDVEGLMRRLREGHILIPTFGHSDDRIVSPGFQRAFVWNKRQMDRFIESLLLGYPLPGIFLIRQEDKRYLVLDGQQRLMTLNYFTSGKHGKVEFSLKNTGNHFRGLTYRTLPEDLRRQLDDTFMQATIVSTDGSPESLDAIYQIFERLNAGATKLTPHEIRVALYAGPIINYIETLNRHDVWRGLYGTRSKRLRDQELVLRIIALYRSASDYRRPLKEFLNNFAGKHRYITDSESVPITDRFTTAARLIQDGPGPSALRLRGRQVNAAFTEAMFVALMRRLDQGSEPDPRAVASGVSAAQSEIESNEDLFTAVSRSTADEDNVRKRLEAMTTHLARI